MRLRSLPGLLLLAVVLLFVVPSAVGYYTDWLWFRELRYEQLFLRTLNAQFVVFVATFTAVFLFLYLNLRFARRRTAERPHVVLGTGADGRPVALEGRQIAGLAMPASLAIAGLVAIASAADWLMWLTYFNAVPFGERDPLFGRDIAFYVFRLPVYQAVRHQAIFVTIATLAGSLLYYVLSGSFVVEARPGVSSWPRIRLVPAARRHLSLLTAMFFALMAWGAWLEIPETLMTPATSSVGFGASYTDVWANIPFLWASIATLTVGAGLALWHGFGRRSWPLPLAVALYILISMTGGVYASFIQRFRVTPNEQNAEQPFIVHNIASTRRAYGLNGVEERELSGDAELSAADILDNAATIENVRLWDHGVLLQTFGQIQKLRNYYDFQHVDNDRYAIDGKLRQVMLSVRELNTETMSNRSWVNERLTFTHGYGLTLGPVNQVTTEGLPVLFVRDLPPVSTVNMRVDQPSVYYGELSSNYAIVKTLQPEFHYPSGENNVTTFYTGTGGVPVGSLMRRLLFAIRFSSTDILVSQLITPDSRIMFYRQIGDRVRTLAPFLRLDADPYPVLTGGRLFWMQDAYTMTANYPYSTPSTLRGRTSSEFNYIRNSVKIVTDAYDGSVSFYLADAADPIAQTIAKIFPGMLRPISEMPADLRQHVRYPEDLFSAQVRIFQTYHMTNPVVFYNKEDQWQIPVIEGGGTSSTPMQPYYTMMRLPDEKDAEFIQMLPFTPRTLDNLSAWMVARSDGANYGKLVVFHFPKEKNAYGPLQIIGRIQQNPIISPLISLWNQQGSEVKWGTLLVIPIKDSILYVRPVYLRSPEGRIPELKRVVVAYQERIVMADTLTECLAQIFARGVAGALAPDQVGNNATSVIATEDVAAPSIKTPPATPTLKALAAEANTHFDNASKALRAGDWALWAEEMKKVQAILERMQAQ